MRGRPLRTHMLLLYVLLAILSGIVVPALGTWLSLRGFRRYVAQRRELALDELAVALVSLYEEDGAWDRRRVMDVLRPAPHWAGLSIVLRGADGREVSRLTPGLMERRSMRGRRQGPGRTDEETPPAERSTIELTLAGEAVGSLDVEHRPPPGRAEREFIAHLARYGLVGGVAMIVVACGLGVVVAGRLSRPVVRAAERTRRIARGERDLAPEPPSGIREMDALLHDVDELGRSLAAQERLRRRLMVDVAHELRTPLTVARTQIEAMADGVWEPTPDRLAACVGEMERLGGLIEDVETVTRLEGEAQAVRPEEMDMVAWLSSVLASFAPVFDQGGVTLSSGLEPGTVASIDPVRFRHALDNLLSNALRYTPRGGRVDVTLRSCEGGAEICVRDTGIGIAPEDLPHVFERFYRADEARARMTGGRGVGLAIAKTAVEAHGGTISATSAQGEGSCFVVTLPAPASLGGRAL